MNDLLGLSNDQEYADAQTFYEDLGALAQQKGYVKVILLEGWVSFHVSVGVPCHTILLLNCVFG